MVEGALINLLKPFENNKSFTQEDFVTNRMVCLSAKINLSSFSSAPTARVPSLSFAQALAVDTLSFTANAGAETTMEVPPNNPDDPMVVVNEATTNSINHSPVLVPRRSRRIANRSVLRGGIT